MNMLVSTAAMGPATAVYANQSAFDTIKKDLTTILGLYRVLAARRPNLVVARKDLDKVASTVANLLTVVEFKDDLRDRDDRPANRVDNDDSSASSTREYRYRSGSGRLSVRSIRLIGGLLAAVCVSIFGAFKKLRGL